jgi:hypothetical protein
MKNIHNILIRNWGIDHLGHSGIHERILLLLEEAVNIRIVWL